MIDILNQLGVIFFLVGLLVIIVLWNEYEKKRKRLFGEAKEKGLCGHGGEFFTVGSVFLDACLCCAYIRYNCSVCKQSFKFLIPDAYVLSKYGFLEKRNNHK